MSWEAILQLKDLQPSSLKQLTHHLDNYKVIQDYNHST